ncbi:MAG TPA: LLM class F420-dependent oxidoreductase, partial [Anaerolineaceae bacterium]
VRDYVQAVAELGYSHIIAYDHILGANPDRPGGWKGAYTYQSSFLEPFVLFSYMAAVSPQLGFMTGILILPQRQTGLVAKQAATLDVLCGGKFRLGVGLGWNEVEYTALNEDFHNRGRRMEEQVALLRQLWTQPLVTFKGQWHTIPDAGLKPLPIQQPIPIWMGGTAVSALERAAKIADGWLPNTRSLEESRLAAHTIQDSLEKAGRTTGEFGIEPRLAFGAGNPADWQKMFRGWLDLGATGFSINTMGSGFQSPQAHIQALGKFAEEMEVKTL